jgi:hypothetical protein
MSIFKTLDEDLLKDIFTNFLIICKMHEKEEEGDRQRDNA